MMSRFLFEDLHSFRAAGSPEGDLWSCSTGLPYLLNGRDIRSPEELLDEEKFEDLCRRVLDARMSIRKVLKDFEAARPNYRHLAAANTNHIYNAWVLFAVKAITLEAWLGNTGNVSHVVVGAPKLKPIRRLSVQPGFHDHIFAAIAGAMEKGPETLLVPPVDAALFGSVFAHVPKFDRVFNIANRTPSAIAFQLWRRVSELAAFGKPKGTIVLFDLTEGLEECFLPLLKDGWRVVCPDASLPSAQEAESIDPETATLIADLGCVWDASVGVSLSSDIKDAAWKVLSGRITVSVSQHPYFLRQARAKVEKWQREYSDAGPVLTLSNGLYGAPERLLDASLRDAGIPVVCVDHGSSKGLSIWHDEGQEDYISFSDRYGTFNDETRLLYDRFKREPKQQVTEVGTPRVFTRQIAPKTQRHVARKRLGAEDSSRVLMYVTSLAINNVPHGFGGGTDWQYAKMQRELVGAFGKFDGQVVIKPYPVQRFADPEQVMLMPLPENTTLAPFGEFRHVRWAADMLLLDISSSTISWALATGKPLIYVDGPRAPLTARAAEAMGAGLFLFDSRADGWVNRVEELLQRPQSEIDAEWSSKEACRTAFDRRFVLGKRNAFVAGVADMVRPYQAQGTA